jgi:cytochrome c oxidase subunit IV
MTAGVTDPTIEPPRRASILGVFGLLAALTLGEILTARSGLDARLRTTALVGLLLAKAGILLAFSLRASWRRSATRLALLAVAAAAGFTVVLMLEAVYRAGVR